MENEGKRRLLALLDILKRKTDEQHTLSTVQLITILKDEYGIPSHRTTIATDVAVLRSMGTDIEVIESTQNKYYMASGPFEIPELKMLIDSVRSFKFITEKKSESLIEKLCSFASEYQSDDLRSDNYLEDYARPKNEMIYYIIDRIDRAIKNKEKISFRYYRFNISGGNLLRQNGEVYRFSPYAMMRNGDFYYAVGFSDKHQKTVTFRIDRIADVPAVLTEPFVDPPDGLDLKHFTKTAFRMFDGVAERVTLSFDNSVIGSVIDQFGSDIRFRTIDENTSAITEDITVSPIFFRWVFGFTGKIAIESPASVRKQYAEMVENAYKEIMKEKTV